MISRRTLVLYGLPGLALGMPGLPVYVYLPSFYAELGLDLAVIGAVLLAARLTDMITDPLIGGWSDRLTTRFGRRKPLIAVGGVIAAIALYMLVEPPDAPGAGYLLGWAMALYVGWTLVNIPYTAWGAELSDEYHTRTRIASAREAAMLVGILIAASLPVLVGGLTPIAVAAIALGAPSLFLLLKCVPEPVAAPKEPIKIGPGLKQLMANAPFRRLLSAWFLNSFANGLPATLFPLFVISVLAGSEAERDQALLLYFVVAVLGIGIWPLLSRRFGKHIVWCAAMSVAIAAFVGVLLLGPGDLPWFLGVCVITGVMLGADLVLPPAMQADVLDVDRLDTGDERAGLLFALWGMAQKLALALGVGISFPLLAWAGFEASAAEPEGLWMLAGLYAGVPVACKAAAILLVRKHPLSHARQQELRADLDRRNTMIRGGAS